MKYKVLGKVIQGEHFGKVLGFPTANLDRREYARKKMKIRLGVWAGMAEIIGSRGKNQVSTSPQSSPRQGRRYAAGIVIGPLDKSGLPKIEAHLIGFKGNLYGKYLITYLITYLRPFRKFRKVEELKGQIKIDLKKIKNIIS